MKHQDPKPNPTIVQEAIDRVIKKMRYRKKVRADVRAELEGHFEDALAECETEQERLQIAQCLVDEFGDTRLLAQLIRRAKKRCRPLWVKVMIRTFQIAGLCVLYFLLCLSRLFIGSPTVKVDLVEHVNEVVQQGHTESQNAWPGLQHAISLYVPIPKMIPTRMPYRDMNDLQRQAIDHNIQENMAAFAALEEAAKKPYCWRQFDPVTRDSQVKGVGSVLTPQLMRTVQINAGMMDQLMPELDEIRSLSFALDNRRQWYVSQAQGELALADVVTLFRLGRLQTGSGLLIKQLVGIAISSLAASSLLDTLDGLEIKESTLAQTQETLAPLFDREHSWIDLTAEKALQEDLIQRGFTDDGHGNGRMLSSGVYLVLGTPRLWWKDLLTLNFPDRQQVQTAVNAFFASMEQWNQQMPWDRRNQTFDWSNPAYNTIVKPAYERVGEIQWRSKLGIQATLTVLAIKRYQAQHGKLPENLQELVTQGLLDKLPRDFFGPEPLTYQRKSDQAFVLYSWGENLKDDHGVPATNETGEPRKYGSQGDWIFWPPK